MVSRRRRVEPGYIYHVLNRGSERQRLFFSQDDYREFESLIQETMSRTPPSTHHRRPLVLNTPNAPARPSVALCAICFCASSSCRLVSAVQAQTFRVGPCAHWPVSN